MASRSLRGGQAKHGGILAVLRLALEEDGQMLTGRNAFAKRCALLRARGRQVEAGRNDRDIEACIRAFLPSFESIQAPGTLDGVTLRTGNLFFIGISERTNKRRGAAVGVSSWGC